MSCGCIYVEAEYVYHTIAKLTLRTVHPRACSECGRVLERGEMYEYYLGEGDDGVDMHVTCEDCLSTREEFFCGAWIFTTLWQDVELHIDDVYGEIDSKCLMALTPRARERVIELIDKCWSDEMREEEDEDE